MNKKIIGIAVIILIVAVLGGYLYYASLVAAEELEKRNTTVNKEVNAYFTNLNVKKGYDGKELGYVITSISIGNITEVSVNEIKVPVSISVNSNDPALIQEYISKSKQVMESVGRDFQGAKYLSPQYIRAINYYESWEAIFIKTGDQWELKSMKKVGQSAQTN